MAIIAVILAAIGLLLLCASIGLAAYWLVTRLKDARRNERPTTSSPVEQAIP